MIASINFIVDPFDIYHMPKYKGLNHIKPGELRQIRLVKAGKAYKIIPDTVILGTSRAHEGISCEHAPLNKFRCANLALHGSTMYENFRFLQHAIGIGTVKRVIIGLDLLSFNQNVDNSRHFSEDHLSVSIDGQPQFMSYRAELIKLSLSLDSLKYTRRTIKKSRKTSNDIEVKPDYQAEWTRHCKGYLDDIWFPKNKPKFDLLPPSEDHSMLNQFAKLVDTAHRHNIDLYIMITPSHAWLWETMDAAGLWSTFEHWKRQLVEIVEVRAREFGETPYPLWDFSGYNSITTTPHPQANSTTPSPWYSDPSHYRHIVGDMVIQTVLGTIDDTQRIPADFGVRINSDNIVQHFNNIRSGQKQYRRAHPEVISMLKQLAIDVEHKRQQTDLD